MNAKNNTSERQALMVALDDNMERQRRQAYLQRVYISGRDGSSCRVAWRVCNVGVLPVRGAIYGHYYESQWDAHIDFLDRSGTESRKGG